METKLKHELKAGTIVKMTPMSEFSYILTTTGDFVCIETGEVYIDDPKDCLIPVYPVVHKNIFEIIGEDLEREEKQLIYDALINKYFSDFEMSQSEHFAKDCFKRNYEVEWTLIDKIRNTWKKLSTF